MLFRSMNVVPMGNARVSFRVVLQNDLKSVSGKATINDTSKDSTLKKSDAKETSANSNKEVKKDKDGKELPQTGLPITQAELPLLGGLTSMAGLFLLKKKNK